MQLRKRLLDRGWHTDRFVGLIQKHNGGLTLADDLHHSHSGGRSFQRPPTRCTWRMKQVLCSADPWATLKNTTCTFLCLRVAAVLPSAHSLLQFGLNSQPLRTHLWLVACAFMACDLLHRVVNHQPCRCQLHEGTHTCTHFALSDQMLCTCLSMRVSSFRCKGSSTQ